MSLQPPLDLTPAPDFSFARFFVADSNQHAVQFLKKWPDWPAPVAALYGESGRGKSHLGQAWAQISGAICLTSPIAEPILTQTLETPVFLDQADRAPEDWLFHLINRALNGHISGLLLCARTPPSGWPVNLADLASRLRNTTTLYINEPEDTLLEPIIRKIFEDRGRFIDRESVCYILTHCERSINALTHLVTALDHAAQSQKRDLNRYFISQYLKDT